MRWLLLFLFAFPVAAANTRWTGTNSQFAISMAIKPDGTNYGSARVFVGGQSHPASCYRGTKGWVTVDYGAGVDPKRIFQFRIVGRAPTTIGCVLDGTNEKFFLKRQQ